MVIAKKPELSTCFEGVSTMAVSVNRFEISKQWTKTLAERYERIMSRIERITRSGYQVKVQWECEFDAWQIVEQ